MPCLLDSMTRAAISAVTNRAGAAHPGRQQTIVAVEGEHRGRQVARQVLLLVHGKLELTVANRLKDVRRQIGGRDLDLVTRLQSSQDRRYRTPPPSFGVGELLSSA
jgi:hypothetical protein